MSFPASIHASVSSALLGRVTRIFNNSVGDVLVETLQNARRAGASRVDIDVLEEDGRSLLVIRDDGTGIADPAKVLTLGDSGWDADTARREDPAGMGVFSLAGRHVEIRSRTAFAEMGWRVEIPADAWESGVSLAIETCAIEPGTELRIDLPEAWARDLATAVSAAAHYYPLPVRFNGDDLAPGDFLSGAVRIVSAQGCRIGVFHDRNYHSGQDPRINFHGLTVACPLPQISEVDGGPSWHVRIDIVDAPALQLVLPARKEMVQNDALDALREAAERSIFETIASTDGHRLSHATWCRAMALDIALPEADTWLSGWIARTADSDSDYLGQRVDEGPMILFPIDDPCLEQSAARVLRAGQVLGGALVREVQEFEGYRWYDALPRISALSFRIATDAGTFRYDSECTLPDTMASGRVRSLQLDVAVSSAQVTQCGPVVHSFPAEVVIATEDQWPDDLDEVIVLLSPDTALDPLDLANLLEAACFCAGDDVDNDSWDTQQREFGTRARQIAFELLQGEDAAIIDRIQVIVANEIGWLIPAGRMMSMLAGDGKAEVRFADQLAA